MIFNETEEQEKAYLQQVLNIINDTINSTDKSVKEHNKNGAIIKQI